jgi:hypothetical protein
MFEKQPRYVELAHSGISAEDFYRQLREDGVNKFGVCIYLRDEFEMGLLECMSLVNHVEPRSLKDS